LGLKRLPGFGVFIYFKYFLRRTPYAWRAVMSYLRKIGFVLCLKLTINKLKIGEIK